MLSRHEIIQKAHELQFEDIGFTTAEPFEPQREILREREAEYAWTSAAGLDLMGGTDPKNVLPEAQTIVVLMELYFRKSYPRNLEPFFGRCYLDDDRITKDGLAVRLKAFRSFLRENGVNSKVPFHLPHRLAAARAGLGTFGKNCLLYSNKIARRSSWVLPIALVVDAEFEADQPTLEVGCPDWCKNACIVSCPTGALKGPRHIDPRRCVSYLTYYGSGLTPLQFREAMGLYVYGCDRCQNVCPRNAAWLAADLPENERVIKKSSDFQLEKLLHMDRVYFDFFVFWFGTHGGERMAVKELTSSSLDDELRGSKLPYTLVQFSGTNCPSCRVVAGILEQIVDEFAECVSITKINIDNEPQLAKGLNIRGVPTLVLFRGNQEIKRSPGFPSKNAIRAFITENIKEGPSG